MDSFFNRVRAFFATDRSIGFGLERLGLATLRYPRAMALAVLAFSIFCATQLPRANVDGDLLRLYAHSGADYDRYADLSETFGTFENDVYVLVTTPRLTEPETLERVRDLAFDLELNEFAVGTMSPFSLRKPDGWGSSVPAVPEGMDDFAEVAVALSDLQQNDPLMRNLITPDLDGMVLIVFPDPSLTKGDGTKAMIASLRATIAPYQDDNISVELTGPPIWTSEMLNAALAEQLSIPLWVLGLGAVLALLAWRSLPIVALVLAPPLLALVWSMGMILFWFGAFSLLSLIVIALVLVLGFAGAMRFTFTWLGYWRDGMAPELAVDVTVRLVGPAVALTLLTTLVAFAALALTPGSGIAEFCLAGAMSVVLLYVCLLTVMPSLLKVAPRLGVRLPRRRFPALTLWGWELARRYNRALAFVAIGLTLLLLIPFGLIKPQFSFEDFVAGDSSALTATAGVDDGVGGVAPLYLRLPLQDRDPNISFRDFDTISTAHNILEAQLGDNKVLSVAALSNYTDNGFSREQVFEAVGPFLRKRFVADDGSQALITGFIPTLIAADQLGQLVAAVQSALNSAGISGTEIGGFRVLTAAATEQVVPRLQLGLTLAALLNLGLIGLAFRSFRLALAAAVPTLLPALGVTAWLYGTGQGLQLFSVLALTIVCALATGSTVQFLAQYRQARRDSGQPDLEAVRQTLERSGGATLATSLIVGLGGVLAAVAPLPPLALFGTVLVLALVIVALGNLLILPALLAAGTRLQDAGDSAAAQAATT